MDIGVRVGQWVSHCDYGKGVVQNLDLAGYAKVQFDLAVRYVRLQDVVVDYRRQKEEEEQQQRRQESYRKQTEVKRNELLSDIRKRLQNEFLSVDSFFSSSCFGLISKAELEKEKIAFVKWWVSENTPKSKSGKKYFPDDEQATAIAAVHGHIQVVARAGSGKTTTLVNRALFLMKHCRVAPDQMLLLAFNRKAALEIRRRLLALLHDLTDAAVANEVARRIREAGWHKKIDKEEIEASAVDAIAAQFGITLPHVMTFHALAYAVIHPEESLLYNEADGQAKGLSRVVQQVIDDHLQIPAIKEQIRQLMLAHFREDWDRIAEGCYNQSKEELLRFRRSLPKESLAGEYVKSYGEKVIADFLFEHDIPYKYERNHWWSGINYRPDFTVFKAPKSGVIIEYFGLKGDADYDDMSEKKREYWEAQKDWTLIEFSPYNIKAKGVDAFRALLKECLASEGIRCIRLSEEEIWHRIRDRAIDRFTTAMVGFIGRCRKRSLFPPELRKLIDSYSPLSSVEKMFLDLAHCLYGAYLNRLSATGEEDFDGLMQRAADAISAGQTLFLRRNTGAGDLASLRYVCIDEFQDFSDLFYRLLCAIRKQDPTVELFCVGDDWQAINGFAGSDLRFFNNFQNFIGESRRLYISTNYRSSASIVAVGNALMKGLGKPAIGHKGSVGTMLVSDINEFEPSLVEKERHSGDIITPAVLRLVNRAFADDLDVVMLCRRNGLPWYVNYQAQAQLGRDGQGLDRYLDLIRSFFPKGLKERVTISTAHKHKGLEKEMVIVLDAVARSYPLIHPDWAFSRILGDSPETITQEERRLLYVALTRAVEKLVIITDGKNRSPFLEELERRHRQTVVRWEDYPPMRSTTASRLIVKVGNQERRGSNPTFALRNELSACRYRPQYGKSFNWEKSFPKDGFSVSTIKAEVWAASADGVEVRILEDTGTLVARFLIDAGNWNCVVDQLESFDTPKTDTD
ncbi:UvrD-helicase domain-containing protein [Methylotetracoccus oryzae]|uniref:UvrD-helicase domain-containing protein n=1 Tax=Methylotetracoccus oryzae TaxID=1919059 RepID=UPI001119EDF6|nr:UvrD-helicase domain-containing protein [Methylotetracoccus oryzae]